MQFDGLGRPFDFSKNNFNFSKVKSLLATRVSIISFSGASVSLISCGLELSTSSGGSVITVFVVFFGILGFVNSVCHLIESDSIVTVLVFSAIMTFVVVSSEEVDGGAFRLSPLFSCRTDISVC